MLNILKSASFHSTKNGTDYTKYLFSEILEEEYGTPIESYFECLVKGSLPDNALKGEIQEVSPYKYAIVYKTDDNDIRCRFINKII